MRYKVNTNGLTYNNLVYLTNFASIVKPAVIPLVLQTKHLCSAVDILRKK